MNTFAKNIKPFVEREIHDSQEAMKNNNPQVAFKHLENAHVLGQNNMVLHLKVHCLMLLWGITQRDFKEIFGQLLRIPGTILGTWMNKLPTGNTGGSRVSAFKHMEIPPELMEIIRQAKQQK